MSEPSRVAGTLSVVDAAQPATLRKAADLCSGFDTVDAGLLIWAASLADDADAWVNRRPTNNNYNPDGKNMAPSHGTNTNRR